MVPPKERFVRPFVNTRTMWRLRRSQGVGVSSLALPCKPEPPIGQRERSSVAFVVLDVL